MSLLIKNRNVRRFASFCIGICGLWITISSQWVLNMDENQSLMRRLDVVPLQGKPKSDKKRPIIHTFYESIPDDERRTGMNDRLDLQLIEAWKEAWYDAGWTPIVLGVKEARLHPAYRTLNSLLEKHIGEDQAVFERYCFLRWLAVAAAGGGWLCDYDVFPLSLTGEKGLTLPNDGKFTAHDGPVPSLLSGSHREWDRVSRLLVEIATTKVSDFGDGNNNIYVSDMNALEYIVKHRKNSDGIVMRRDVTREISLLSKGKVDCDTLQGKLAAHFSHRRMTEAWVKGKSMPEIVFKKDIAGHRAIYAPKFRNLWKSQCAQE